MVARRPRVKKKTPGFGERELKRTTSSAARKRQTPAAAARAAEAKRRAAAMPITGPRARQRRQSGRLGVSTKKRVALGGKKKKRRPGLPRLAPTTPNANYYNNSTSAAGGRSNGNSRSSNSRSSSATRHTNGSNNSSRGGGSTISTICPGQVLNLADPNPATSCFIRGMQERLGPQIQGITQAIASGGDSCKSVGPKTPKPHQHSVIEIAGAMAVRTPAQMNGQRGLLVFHNTGSGKCLDKNTRLIAYDGTILTAGDLKPGMQLLGMDGTPRTVLDVGRGTEEMYEIRPTKGEAWRCNESHVLSLKYNRHGKVVKGRDGWYVYYHEYVSEDRGVFRSKHFIREDEACAFAAGFGDDHIVDMELREYLNLPIYMRHFLKLFRADRLTFAPRAEPAIDPYVLGAWLGDGHAKGPEFTLGDAEIVAEIEARTGLSMSVQGCTADKAAPNYRLRHPDGHELKGRVNPFQNQLHACGLIKNKHIPDDVRCGSVQTRLAVLAGLLDTDGHLQGNCYEIIQKRPRLADDIAFVARSLGFAAYVNQVTKTCVKPCGERVAGTYHRVRISGAGLEDLPVVVSRKRAASRCQIKDALRTGFDVVPMGVGEYVGPALDGDHRYLLWDCTVTHNTVTALGIMLKFWKTNRRIVLATTVGNEKDNNKIKYLKNLLEVYPKEAREIVFPGINIPTDKAGMDAFIADAGNQAKFGGRYMAVSFTKLASWLLEPNPNGGPPKDKQTDWGVGEPLGIQGMFIKGKDGAVMREKAVLILDEVQSLFTPEKYLSASEYLVGYSGPGYKQRFPGHVPALLDPKIAPHVYIFAMTATPGNEVKDIIKILNFVRPLKGPEYKVQGPAFTEADAKDPRKFAGLVSYVDVRSDTSSYGKKQVENVFVPMDTKYYTAFLKTVATKLGDGDLTHPSRADPKQQARNAAAAAKSGAGAPRAMKFMLKQRTAGNFVGREAAKAAGFNDADMQRLAAASPPRVVKVDNNQVRLLSPKLLQAIDVISNPERLKGKQYAYVADPGTVKVVKKVLLSMKWHLITKGDFGPNREPKASILTPGTRRFMLYKAGQIDNIKYEAKDLEMFAKYFDHPANKYGDVCRLALATETYYQGVDFDGLAGVHLIDQLFNATADQQAVGRALRLCKQAPDGMVARVFRYFSVPAPDFQPPEAGHGGGGRGGRGGRGGGGRGGRGGGDGSGGRGRSLADVHRLIKAMPPRIMYDGVMAPEGTNVAQYNRYRGVNSYVLAMGACLQQPVTAFELGLKAFAVDCALFKNLYHSTQKFECGQVPNAKVSAGQCTVSAAQMLKNTPRNVAPPPPSSSALSRPSSSALSRPSSSALSRPSSSVSSRPSSSVSSRPSSSSSRRNNGPSTPNISSWPGSTSSAAVTTRYRPGIAKVPAVRFNGGRVIVPNANKAQGQRQGIRQAKLMPKVPAIVLPPTRGPMVVPNKRVAVSAAPRIPNKRVVNNKRVAVSTASSKRVVVNNKQRPVATTVQKRSWTNWLFGIRRPNTSPPTRPSGRPPTNSRVPPSSISYYQPLRAGLLTRR